MRVYLAGNLSQLKTKGREKAVLEKMIKNRSIQKAHVFLFLKPMEG